VPDVLHAHHRQARDFAARIDDIRTVALALARDDDAHELLREANRLHDHRFQIVVIGEFSRGKSTLINALVGQKLLPAKLRPTTAALTHIQDGPNLTVTVTRVGGRQESIEPTDLASVVTGEAAAHVQRVDVRAPCGWLSNGVELIDTPGVNDLNLLREDVTLRFLPNADAAIFVLDAKACFTETEREFLARDVVRTNLQRVFFVINKMDQVDEPGLGERLVERVRSLTRGIIASPRIFLVAAKPALDAQVAGAAAPASTGIPDLIGALSHFLAKDRGASTLMRVSANVDAAADRLGEGIAVRLAALEGEQSGSRKMLDELRAETQRQTAELARLRAGWAETVSAVADDARADLHRRASEVARPLAAGFDTAQGAVNVDGVIALVRQAFRRIAEESQHRVVQEVQACAQRVAQDVSALEATMRRLVPATKVGPIARVGEDTPMVTPMSALVAAGAMGLATALSIASGGVLLIGALAFLAARAKGRDDPIAVARRNLDRMIEQATEQISAALVEQAMSVGEAAWSDVGSAATSRVAEARRALDEAQTDLGRSASSRVEEAKRLGDLQQQLAAARAGARRAALDALAAGAVG